MWVLTRKPGPSQVSWTKLGCGWVMGCWGHAVRTLRGSLPVWWKWGSWFWTNTWWSISWGPDPGDSTFLARLVRFPPGANHSGHSPQWPYSPQDDAVSAPWPFDLGRWWRLSEPMDTVEAQNAPPLKGEQAHCQSVLCFPPCDCSLPHLSPPNMSDWQFVLITSTFLSLADSIAYRCFLF